MVVHSRDATTIPYKLLVEYEYTYYNGSIEVTTIPRSHS
jgi:hypothetical protein